MYRIAYCKENFKENSSTLIDKIDVCRLVIKKDYLENKELLLGKTCQWTITISVGKTDNVRLCNEHIDIKYTDIYNQMYEFCENCPKFNITY